MKLIFICSPFRGEVERNIEYAKQLCKEVISMGHIPFAPHLLYPQFLDDNIKHERDMGINAGLKILELCDDMYIGYEYGVSEGMQKEIDFFLNIIQQKERHDRKTIGESTQ